MNTKTFFSFFISLAILANTQVATANTRAGNGGNTLQVTLEHLRVQIVRTLEKVLSSENPYHVAKTACLWTLPDKFVQAETCAQLIVTTAQQIIDINMSEQAPAIKFYNYDDTKFDIECGAAPLFSLDHPVEAWTLPDYNSPICFNYRILGTHKTQERLISLLYHELGHKVDFRGIKISDESPTGGFETGEDLLNAAGWSIAELSLEFEHIQLVYIIMDEFQCDFSTLPNTTNSPYTYSKTFFAIRKFNEPNRPMSGGYTVETATSLKDLVYFNKGAFKVNIAVHEPTYCEKQSIVEIDKNRYTDFEVMYLDEETDEMHVFDHYRMTGYSPFCDSEQHIFEASDDEVSVRCAYVGTRILP